MILLILFLILTNSGCAKLAHLQELLTLKAFSEERDAQDKFVADELKRFEKVAAAVDDGTIANLKTGAEVLQAFGRPMASQVITREGKQFQQWLYRHPILSLAKSRVYLYLTPESRLVHWEHIENENAQAPSAKK